MCCHPDGDLVDCNGDSNRQVTTGLNHHCLKNKFIAVGTSAKRTRGQRVWQPLVKCTMLMIGTSWTCGGSALGEESLKENSIRIITLEFKLSVERGSLLHTPSQQDTEV